MSTHRYDFIGFCVVVQNAATAVQTSGWLTNSNSHCTVVLTIELNCRRRNVIHAIFIDILLYAGCTKIHIWKYLQKVSDLESSETVQFDWPYCAICYLKVVCINNVIILCHFWVISTFTVCVTAFKSFSLYMTFKITGIMCFLVYMYFNIWYICQGIRVSSESWIFKMWKI